MELVKSDLENAENQLKIFRESNQQFGNSPSLLLTHERMTREIEVQKNIFITLKQQFELLNIEEIGNSSMFHILELPEAPLKWSKPKRKRIVLISCILGLGIGLLYSVIMQQFDNISNDDKGRIKLIIQNIKR